MRIRIEGGEFPVISEQAQDVLMRVARRIVHLAAGLDVDDILGKLTWDLSSGEMEPGQKAQIRDDRRKPLAVVWVHFAKDGSDIHKVDVVSLAAAE